MSDQLQASTPPEELGEWVTNTRKEPLTPKSSGFYSQEKCDSYNKWVALHLIGPPKATLWYSVAQLSTSHVGVYLRPGQERMPWPGQLPPSQ